MGWETKKSGFCHSCQTFVKSSEMVLIAMTWWFHTQQTLFHTAVGDIIRCYLREEQSERVTSCADAIWSREETWSCSLLWSAWERDRKIAEKEGRTADERKGITINIWFQSKNEKWQWRKKKTWSEKGKNEIRWMKMWWLLCNGLAATHTHTGFIWHHVNWTESRSIRKNFIRGEVTALRWPEARRFLLVFTANKSSPNQMLGGRKNTNEWNETNRIWIETQRNWTTNSNIQNGGFTTSNHHHGMLKEFTLLFVIPSFCRLSVIVLKSVFLKSTTQCRNVASSQPPTLFSPLLPPPTPLSVLRSSSDRALSEKNKATLPKEKQKKLEEKAGIPLVWCNAFHLVCPAALRPASTSVSLHCSDPLSPFAEHVHALQKITPLSSNF